MSADISHLSPKKISYSLTQFYKSPTHVGSYICILSIYISATIVTPEYYDYIPSIKTMNSIDNKYDTPLATSSTTEPPLPSSYTAKPVPFPSSPVPHTENNNDHPTPTNPSPPLRPITVPSDGDEFTTVRIQEGRGCSVVEEVARNVSYLLSILFIVLIEGM